MSPGLAAQRHVCLFCHESRDSLQGETAANSLPRLSTRDLNQRQFSRTLPGQQQACLWEKSVFMREINSCLSEQRNSIELGKHTLKTSPPYVPLCKEQTVSDRKAPAVKRSQTKHIFKALKEVREVLNMLETLRRQKKPKPQTPAKP